METSQDPSFDDTLALPGEPEKPSVGPVTHQPLHAPAPKKKRSKWLYAGVFIVLIGGAAAAAVVTTKKPGSQTVTPNPAPATPPPAVDTGVQDVPAAAATKEFENGPLGVTFTYPTTWTVTETTDSGIRAESPKFNYTTSGSAKVNGNFRVYIRKGARAADSKVIGRGVAITASEKLVYTKPTSGQRADTLLSYFGLDDKDNFNYFFVASNFNLQPGDTLGPTYGKEPETYIIAGGFSATELKDDMSFNSVSLSYYVKSQALSQAKDILKSLQLY